MKRMISLCVTSLFLSPLAFAGGPPVTMSGPTPAIAPSYSVGISSTVIYTITNNVPKRLPVTVSGITGAITRTTVANDCGATLPAASTSSPSTCNIGVVITPTESEIGSAVSHTMLVDYGGRKPLTNTFSFTARQSFAYIAGRNGTISSCQVNPTTGQFSACGNSGGTGFNTPTEVVMNTFGGINYAYIPNLSSGRISRCTLTANTGQLSSCVDSGAGAIFANPWGIAFYTPTNGNIYAYVPAGGTSTVLQCLVNSNTGLLSSCVDSGAGAVFTAGNADDSEYIAFNTVGEKTYVYVTEGQTGAGQVVTQCLVNAASGQFSNCANFNLGLPGVTGIAFDTISGQSVAYLSSWNLAQVFICSVNATNGQLSCSNSGQTGYGNQQITIATVGGTGYTFLPNSGTNAVSKCQINQGAGALINCGDSGAGAIFTQAQAVAIF